VLEQLAMLLVAQGRADMLGSEDLQDVEVGFDSCLSRCRPVLLVAW